MSTRVHVVLRSDVDMGDAWAIHGVFSSEHRANESCGKPGRYMIGTCALDISYAPGSLRNVRMVTTMSGAHVTPARWPKDKGWAP